VRTEGEQRAVFSGEYPQRCGEYSLLRTALSPEAYQRELFRLHWAQWGGELLGEVRYGVLADATSRPFLVHPSRPLGDLIRVANKWSSNVATRQLALTLGAERFGAPATLEKARTAVLAVLEELGVDLQGMVIDNGSGLSRRTRITPFQMAQVLQAGWNSPQRPEFISSMAIAGLDGTAREGFRQEGLRGRMHLKTGRLNGVAAVAGYLRNARNEDLLVVVFVNHPQAHQGVGTEIQDAVLRWVLQQ
jgi:D-alanyl-D-alanine carboxypeptidase/D-alanyl-D-alanine-endopeptidase (penicillin-binding protein 4)